MKPKITKLFVFASGGSSACIHYDLGEHQTNKTPSLGSNPDTIESETYKVMKMAYDFIEQLKPKQVAEKMPEFLSIPKGNYVIGEDEPQVKKSAQMPTRSIDTFSPLIKQPLENTDVANPHGDDSHATPIDLHI